MTNMTNTTNTVQTDVSSNSKQALATALAYTPHHSKGCPR
jgi:hypothetical protein